MATPREQHGARRGAHVLGSGHQDGRQPLVEDRDAAAQHGLGADAASDTPSPARQAAERARAEDATRAAQDAEGEYRGEV